MSNQIPETRDISVQTCQSMQQSHECFDLNSSNETQHLVRQSPSNLHVMGGLFRQETNAQNHQRLENRNNVVSDSVKNNVTAQSSDQASLLQNQNYYQDIQNSQINTSENSTVLQTENSEAEFNDSKNCVIGMHNLYEDISSDLDIIEIKRDRSTQTLELNPQNSDYIKKDHFHSSNTQNKKPQISDYTKKEQLHGIIVQNQTLQNAGKRSKRTNSNLQFLEESTAKIRTSDKALSERYMDVARGSNSENTRKRSKRNKNNIQSLENSCAQSGHSTKSDFSNKRNINPNEISQSSKINSEISHDRNKKILCDNMKIDNVENLAFRPVRSITDGRNNFGGNASQFLTQQPHPLASQQQLCLKNKDPTLSERSSHVHGPSQAVQHNAENIALLSAQEQQQRFMSQQGQYWGNLQPAHCRGSSNLIYPPFNIFQPNAVNLTEQPPRMVSQQDIHSQNMGPIHSRESSSLVYPPFQSVQQNAMNLTQHQPRVVTQEELHSQNMGPTHSRENCSLIYPPYQNVHPNAVNTVQQQPRLVLQQELRPENNGPTHSRETRNFIHRPVPVQIIQPNAEFRNNYQSYVNLNFQTLANLHHCDICKDLICSNPFFRDEQRSLGFTVRCPACDLGFKYYPCLDFHLEKHLYNRRYNCEYCGIELHFIKDLRIHLASCAEAPSNRFRNNLGN